MNPSIRPSLLSLALTVIGVAAICYALITTHTERRPVWVLAVGLASVLLWLMRSILARVGWRPVSTTCAVAMVLLGSLVAAPTNALTVVPAAVGVLVVIGDLAYPLAAGLALAVVGMAVVAIGAVPTGAEVPTVLAIIGGFVLAVFAGLSRRQYRRAEEQTVQLRERELRLREESARVAIARDLHDVLAHSLGGLVIQLDAADALLESGDSGAARTRVTDARRLAADGLADARRAVDALREPATADSPAVAPEDVVTALQELVAAHHTLGGHAELQIDGTGSPLEPQQAAALQRALQEALSNARKHAAGEPVAVRLAWQNDRVRLTVSNPLGGTPSALAGSGGGHGLEGMRERFGALAPGGTATASTEGGRFTVTAETMLP